MKKITIAIDGFSSSGKSTMAKQLAKKIGYVYVDSGAMYRATTLYAIRNGMTDKEAGVDTQALIKALPMIDITFAITPEDTQHTILNGEDVDKEIRGMEGSGWGRPVAVFPEVRHYLVGLQQQYGKDKGIGMDGRDIGTTVFPDAEMKVFVQASPEVRARRRYDELIEKGTPSDYESVLANIKERDHIDSTRKESPLRKAEDAFVLDNDNLTREEQMDVLVKLFDEKTSGED